MWKKIKSWFTKKPNNKKDLSVKSNLIQYFTNVTSFTESSYEPLALQGNYTKIYYNPTTKIVVCISNKYCVDSAKFAVNFPDLDLWECLDITPELRVMNPKVNPEDLIIERNSGVISKFQ